MNWNRLAGILFLLCPFFLAAQPSEKMEAANALYDQSEFEKAINIYEELLTQGFESSTLHYNLGNAYFKNQQLGKSILHFEKTLKLASGHKDARYNLEIAKDETKNEVVELSPFFLNKWFKGIRNLFSSSTWSILFIFFLLLAVLSFGLWLINKEKQKKKWGFLLLFPFLLLGLLSFLFAKNKYHYEQDSAELIVIAETVDLKHAPDEKSDTVIGLFEGLKLLVKDEIGEWYEVELPDKERGWLRKSTVEKI